MTMMMILLSWWWWRCWWFWNHDDDNDHYDDEDDACCDIGCTVLAKIFSKLQGAFTEIVGICQFLFCKMIAFVYLGHGFIRRIAPSRLLKIVGMSIVVQSGCFLYMPERRVCSSDCTFFIAQNWFFGWVECHEASQAELEKKKWCAFLSTVPCVSDGRWLTVLNGYRDNSLWWWAWWW